MFAYNQNAKRFKLSILGLYKMISLQAYKVAALFKFGSRISMGSFEMGAPLQI